MMYSSYGAHIPDALPVTYPQDVFFDDLSTQMAISQASRRLSRGSGGQRAGLAMRVSKPISINDSPSSSNKSNRRRTMMGGDVWTGRKQQPFLDHLSMPQHIQQHVDSVPSRKQPSRPLSWHSSSYHLQTPPQPIFVQQAPHPHRHQQEQAGLSFSMPTMYGIESNDFYGNQAQVSPPMTSYSNDTSPSSTFSPLPLFPVSGNTQYQHFDGWDVSQKSGHVHAGHDNQSTNESLPTYGSSLVNTRPTNTYGLDWNTFIMQGFNNTTPPTPETFSLAQRQPEVSEAAVPYEALEETAEEGEVLFGMGLYDGPDKLAEDPHLNNYRSTMSSLLGSSYRPYEPQGKGLKLEETWEPPKAEEDEAEEEEEGEEEAE
ncbi:hypothetical protein NOR_03267 [Metarhizium rileyi]|uniref:Uncharacterized protein n=1 Tax=Metarhizium rileyi (strain RCEF 4871) TaxID=1649241 RepID=A0A162JK76_METRR|nr:hypothetical protein NOR_03267 [Metarhizium rileyi RCEF 4871]TWU78349.1 hypothetical protein ED733_008583 [Metarhizium rileyi]